MSHSSADSQHIDPASLLAIEPLPPDMKRLQFLALIVGAAGLGLLAVGFLFNAEHAFRSYLYGYLFWLTIIIGSFVWTMIGSLVGGQFAVVVRRLMEANAANLWIWALLFIPILLGLNHLYPWATPELVSQSKVLTGRASYMNAEGFTVRAAFYFAVWITISFFINKWSRDLDKTGDFSYRKKSGVLAAGGMVIYLVTITLAITDWIVSREPTWYSAIIGLLTGVGQASSALSFSVLMFAFLAYSKPFKDLWRPQQFNDLGNLMLTLTILWAYMSFAQFLVQWSGNMREEVVYYTHRGLAGDVPNGWRWLGLSLVIFHFFVPFFILLGRNNKRKIPIITSVAALILVARSLDMLWLVAPSGTWTPTTSVEHSESGSVFWTDLPALLGFAGIGFFLFAMNLARKPLIPPYLAQATGMLDPDPHAAYNDQAEETYDVPGMPRTVPGQH